MWRNYGILPIVLNQTSDFCEKWLLWRQLLGATTVGVEFKTMRFNITHRVFWAILTANAIIVLCMFLIMQWSLDRGFLKYVNNLEQHRLDRLAVKLGQVYSARGNWDILKERPATIQRLIIETIAEDPAPYPTSPVDNDARRESPPSRDRL